MAEAKFVLGSSARTAARIVVSATFTGEQIEPFLLFWLEALGFEGRVEFAPYNQVFQQLLDPDSQFAHNKSGFNLVLVRFEDWARFKPDGWDEPTILSAADELAQGLVSFSTRNTAPTIVCSMPPSPNVMHEQHRQGFLNTLEERMRSLTGTLESIHWLGRDELRRYPVACPHDEIGNCVGHMPYTAPTLAAVSTVIARRIHLIHCAPYKVIALDCDHTLWTGVVGEDGPQGVTLGPGAKALQEFVVEQQAAGMLVCLVSKNAEADVLDTFDIRDDFPLRRKHLRQCIGKTSTEHGSSSKPAISARF